MLRQKIFIYGVVSQGGGSFTMTPFFLSGSVAGYTNEGDVITDTANKRFQITAIQSKPLVDGGQITVLSLDNSAPIEDSDYNSNIETPGQIDMGPAVTTTGQILTSAVQSAPLYKHRITATWTTSAEAAKGTIGDSLIDATGKEYVISDMPSGNLSGQFYVVEKEKTGKSPAQGICGLYRATPNLKAYQGPAVSDQANEAIRNRDFKWLDLLQENAAGAIVSNVAPVEVPDGVLMTFTLPNSHIFKAGTLVVELNGLSETAFTEGAGRTTFTLTTDWVPDALDNIRLTYQRA